MRAEAFPIKWSGVDSSTFGATVNSDALSVEDASLAAVQIIMTGGSPVGSLKLQGSIDGSNWHDITSSTVAVGSAADDALWNIIGIGYPTIRVVYTRTSGSTTATGFLFKKGEAD